MRLCMHIKESFYLEHSQVMSLIHLCHSDVMLLLITSDTQSAGFSSLRTVCILSMHGKHRAVWSKIRRTEPGDWSFCRSVSGRNDRQPRFQIQASDKVVDKSMKLRLLSQVGNIFNGSLVLKGTEKLLKVLVFLATQNFVDTVSPFQLNCNCVASIVVL